VAAAHATTNGTYVPASWFTRLRTGDPPRTGPPPCTVTSRRAWRYRLTHPAEPK